MKTKKVGKIVSLLVAIVLVATIMIPAASVLADSAAQKYPGAEWTEVSSYKELKTALDNAKTDGTKTYIRLKEKIDMPQGARFVSGGAKGLFLGEVIKMDKVRQVTGKKKNGALWDVQTSDPLSNQAAMDFFNDAGLGPATETNPFDELKQGKHATDPANFYIVITSSNLRKIEKIFNFTETKYTNTTGTPDKATKEDPLAYARDYPSYNDVNLIVYEDTDVVIDLNGKSIDAGQGSTAYSGIPQYIQSIFVVNGKLTVEDFVGGGTLTGASGYIAEGTYSLSEAPFTDNMQRHRYLDENLNYVDKSRNDNDTWSSLGHDLDKLKWKISAVNHAGGNINDGNGDARSAYYINQNSVTEIRGGAVYIGSTGEFTLNGGAITKNCSWMESSSSGGGQAVSMMKKDADSVAKGGGVYVEAGGTFNMNGGEISQNAARAYQNVGSGYLNAYAYGGGVYLDNAADGKVATFNMHGGKIAENAAYAETNANGKTKSSEADGAGIYVGTGAVCNIIGSGDAEGKTSEEMLASFPQITNNSCGAETLKGVREGATVKVQGAGVYCAGTLNIEKANISANDFAEAYNDLADSDTASMATHVMRDDERTKSVTGASMPGTNTGLALYVLDYNNPGEQQTPKTLITRLDPRFKDNLELATELVKHEKSGVYGTGRGNSANKMTSDGAGVCLASTGTINIGERVWIYDNYDLVTTGHKAFGDTRNFYRYWVQEYTYHDPVVGTDLSVTDAATAGKKITDAAGRYVYYGTRTTGAGNGYTWSDTRDDAYLPEGVAMYKGGSLFECRIGVNYYNMVNSDGAVSAGAMGQAGNRVIVKSSTNLNSNVWGTTKSTPSARDIQFFYLNDNNKNYEGGLVDSSTKYTLPANKKPKNVWLCNPSTTATYNTRDRVAAVKADAASGATGDDVFDDTKKVMSPYEGYVNYDVAYPENTWIYHPQAGVTNVKDWYRYSQPTFRISDPDNYPGGADTTVNSFNNAIVNLPQRAYQLTADMLRSLPESYRKAKYMDYKVVYDNNGFGTESEPVLRFGQNVDRQMYFTVDFDEANVHYYGESGLNTNLSTGSSIGDIAVTSLDSSRKTFVPGINSDVYYYKGSSNPQGTVSINPVVPDYNIYKNASILQTRINNRKNELTSITETNSIEDADLYFKGWSQYVSYGYKDASGKVVNASVNTVPQASDKDGKLSVSGSNTINGITALNYHNSKSAYVFDLSKIYNPNVNAQPCFSLTATWYTKEELAEARKKVSNVKYQVIKSADNKDLLRVVAIAGSDYPDFEAVGFVISTTNATPTIEGGYDYVANSDIYERLGVTKDGTQMCYDVDRLLGGNYYGAATGNHPSIKIDEEFKWEFTEGSMFADNVTIGQTGKPGYKDAGLFYTNILIDDKNRNTVYFVTPYAKLYDGTYYYGESRAVCYADYYVAS